jgi:hypothetical protein
MRWYPSWEEIQYWLTLKEEYISWRETQGLIADMEHWKNKYIYTDMHEIFFVEFPCLFYEWLKRKTSTNIDLRTQEPLVWDQITLDRMKALDNKWT